MVIALSCHASRCLAGARTIPRTCDGTRAPVPDRTVRDKLAAGRKAVMALKVRYPKIDYADIRAHWAPNIAFAQHNNATSLIPTPVEPWLIKVMHASLARLSDKDVALREDVLGFIGQESQHFRQHRLFNAVLIAQGYPDLADYERSLAADLDGFLKDRSLKFQLAYSDGFESLGAVQAGVWFERSDAFLEGADEKMAALWKWHMAEEFEHRTVCYDLYHALFGRGIWKAIVNGYFYRLYGFLYAMFHLQGYMAKMLDYMLAIDRQAMSAGQKAKLDEDLKALKAFQRSTALPQLLKNFLPWYDPARKRAPKGMEAYLRAFEPGGAMARPERGPAAAAEA
jgi:predicted metal-dependent hydrolase